MTPAAPRVMGWTILPVPSHHHRHSPEPLSAPTPITLEPDKSLASYFATRSIAADHPDALVVRIRGYQWWWEVTYADPSPDQVFLTANELHLPLGRPVRLELAAADVIHSFWVP